MYEYIMLGATRLHAGASIVYIICKCVHLDFQLNWSKHISVVKNKIAKNVSVMYRVRHLLNKTALYHLYCTLILPYLNYCCEAWGQYVQKSYSAFVHYSEKGN